LPDLAHPTSARETPAQTAAREEREAEPPVTAWPGYRYEPRPPKCCCPRALEIRRAGALEGGWRISEYWPENFPVWGERTGPAETDVSNDRSLGPTDVPQALESDRKDHYGSGALDALYDPGMVKSGLPPHPQESLRGPGAPRNIGRRYQIIADYEWRDAQVERACVFHWEKQNKCTELEDEQGRLKPDPDGQWTPCRGGGLEDPYAVQRRGGFAPDRWGAANTKTIPGGGRRPDRQLWVDVPQRVHERGEEPEAPIYFRWWIEADPSCGCERPFVGAEATLGFVRIPGKAYPEARWLHFKDGLASEGEFTPRTHYPQ